jgi:hypothetical protein
VEFRASGVSGVPGPETVWESRAGTTLGTTGLGCGLTNVGGADALPSIALLMCGIAVCIGIAGGAVAGAIRRRGEPNEGGTVDGASAVRESPRYEADDDTVAGVVAAVVLFPAIPFPCVWNNNGNCPPVAAAAGRTPVPHPAGCCGTDECIQVNRKEGKRKRNNDKQRRNGEERGSGELVDGRVESDARCRIRQRAANQACLLCGRTVPSTSPPVTSTATPSWPPRFLPFPSLSRRASLSFSSCLVCCLSLLLAFLLDARTAFVPFFSFQKFFLC